MSPSEKKRPTEEEQERHLFFRCRGEAFAVSIASVLEVVVDAHLTPVPLAPPEVLGVVNHRGKIFTVVDFSRLARLGQETDGARQAVFLERPDMSVGIAVEAIEGISWVPRRLLEAAGSPGAAGRQPFLRGLLDFEGKVAAVVEAEKLADTIARLPEIPGA